MQRSDKMVQEYSKKVKKDDWIFVYKTFVFQKKKKNIFFF